MIVPSIDLMQGRAVQLRGGRDFVLDGGDPLARLEEFAVAGEVAVVDLDAALGKGGSSNAALIREMVRRAPCRVGGGIRDLDTARAWLDAGAAKIMIGTAASPEFCAALPRERVIAAVDAERGQVVVEGWRTATGTPVLERIRELAPVVGGFLFTQVEKEGAMSGFDFQAVAAAVRASEEVRLTAAGGITTATEIAELDRIGADAQVGMALYTGRLALGEAVAAPLVKPVGDVWPTVVCDEWGHAPGLVLSTREALAPGIAERKGIYWSRSRQALWEKGATSGNTQELVRVDLDCDRDALRFTVRQRGAGFCHLERRSCWPSGFDLDDLARTITERATRPEPGSGTAKLLADSALLAAKLQEEAEELGRAHERADVGHETADVLYLALVAVVREGGGGAGAGAPLFYDRPALREALARLPAGDRARLERVAERIRGFAEAQYRALCPVAVSVPGGVAEHQIAPVERAGCYAPGGRYPLPSSVLMTAVTARVAGVRDIWVASPKPHALSLAAAAIAGADGLLAAGGAHAIAALAYGAGPIASRDVIVGPGNRYVAAAKQLVSGAVAIDMLAGPSELTIFADHPASTRRGAAAAEVLGDYGAGPNHVLPTGGTARATGGLSVYTFLRVRTWLRIDDTTAARPLIEDAIWLGRAEGLEAHARAAERRLRS